jgi:predicted acetyltransferase
MSSIRYLKRKDFEPFVDIVLRAYPGFKETTEEQRRKFIKRCVTEQRESTTENYYGLYRQKKLLGGMLLHDFVMTFGSLHMPVGGVGLVAVDLVHKKEKVCKELITYFLEHYAAKNTYLAALHPFRPDFYRNMGFGYGTKISTYTIKPAHLPRGQSKAHIAQLTEKDMRGLLACYNRYAEKTHGMLQRSARYMQRLTQQEARYVVGYKKQAMILGYIIFSFEPHSKGNFVSNNLHVHEFVYENQEVLSELFTFLHTQADQINAVQYATHEENFHFVPHDPRNGTERMIAPLYHESNAQGIGIMYRVIDVKGLFRYLAQHNFNNQSCVLRITVRDTFFSRNSGSTIVDFMDGRPRVRTRGAYLTDITLDVSDFSSLIMGVVDFLTLQRYGLVHISDSRYATTVNRIFRMPHKPVCMTMF